MSDEQVIREWRSTGRTRASRASASTRCARPAGRACASRRRRSTPRTRRAASHAVGQVRALRVAGRAARRLRRAVLSPVVRRGAVRCAGRPAARVRRAAAGRRSGAFPLTLLTPKAHGFLNSSYGNMDRQLRLMGRGQPVILHPLDAAERAIGDGDPVTLASARGRMRGRAQLSADVARGVVVSPVGFWIDGTATPARRHRERGDRDRLRRHGPRAGVLRHARRGQPGGDVPPVAPPVPASPPPVPSPAVL